MRTAISKRTSRWRESLQKKYPSDARNGRAAERLLQLADEAASLSDQQWAELQPFYSWSSESWIESVSLAARHVEFQRNIRTFPAFVQNLICILSEERAAA